MFLIIVMEPKNGSPTRGQHALGHMGAMRRDTPGLVRTKGRVVQESPTLFNKEHFLQGSTLAATLILL